MTDKYRITVLQDRCKGCELCVEICPRKMLSLSRNLTRKGYHFACPLDEDECVNCGLCELICPDFAITVNTGGATDDAGKKTA